MPGKDEKLREKVFQGFQAVKQDIEGLKIRLQLLEEENKRLREELKQANSEPKNESQKSLNAETLRRIVSEIVGEAPETPNTKAGESLRFVSAETEPTPIPEIKGKPDKLKEDLLKSYEKNRKNIVKQQILAEAQKAQYTKSTLRDLVVGEKKYCSKASFYRYVEELELAGLLTYKRRKNKTIIEVLVLQE